MKTDSQASNHLNVRGILTQTFAMFIDAYRELNSKKLFWITLVLSGLVVVAFAGVGFSDTGFSIFGKTFRSPFFNTRFLPLVQLYKNLFITLGVQWWLGFLAIILALISTAPMFPDFLGNGAVDLYLARPLGRARLFLTKYFVGLLFVSFQVTIFCLASFVVIGVRAGAWVPGIFLAVPVVLLLFSYIWCICAFVGTWTRSTIAAILLTIMAWGLISGIHAGESALLMFSTSTQVEKDELVKDIDQYEADISTLKSKPATTQPGSFESARLKNLTMTLDKAREDLPKIENPYKSWHSLLYAVKWPLPKTTETTNLLERWLDKQFRDVHNRPNRPDSDRIDQEAGRNFFQNRRVRQQTLIETDKLLRERSVTWIIGTSLLFEAFMLAFTTWIFSRRDF